MTYAKAIVFAFTAVGETADAFILPVGDKTFLSTGKDFMAISLVTYIPYKLVIGSLVNIMECHGKFYHTKAGGKMATMYTYYINNILAEFITKLVQLFPAKLFQICGGMNHLQQGARCYLH